MLFGSLKNLSVIAIVPLVMIASGSPDRALAQETAATTILKVDVEEPSPKQFGFNDPFQLIVKPGSVPSDIQVRVFRNSKKILSVDGKGWVKQEGQCLVYDSLVLTPKPTSSSLTFGWNFDSRSASWLTRSADRFEDTMYLLVFEAGGRPDGSLKIFRDDVKTYFNNGFEIKILADGFGSPGPPPLAPVTARPGAVVPSPPPPIPCLHVKALLNTGDALAEELACNSPLPASTASGDAGVGGY